MSEEWATCKDLKPEEFDHVTKVQPLIQKATFGAGCFWGTEKFFAKDLQEKFPLGVVSTSTGYMNTDPGSEVE